MKTEALRGPCRLCGTSYGPTAPGGKTPARRNLEAYGFEGLGCLTCYNRLAQRHCREMKKCAARAAKA